MKPQNIFVFAVCGAGEYIDALNFSIRYLKQFSNNEIIVVTELSRNEVPILHDRIIDVTTPEGLNNHQASIYLKTSLHRYLDMDHRYCYLDGDVVAVKPGVDQIFMYDLGPITFASDHCKMPAFSPHAVNCDCWGTRRQRDAEKLEALQKKYVARSPEDQQLKKQLQSEIDDFIEKRTLAFFGDNASERFLEWQQMYTPDITAKREELNRLFKEMPHGLRTLPYFFKEIWPRYRRKFKNPGWYDRDNNLIITKRKDKPGDWHAEARVKIGEKYKCEWNPADQSWIFPDRGILYTNPIMMIERESNFVWKEESHEFFNSDGESVFSPRCAHLQAQIQTKFGIQITDPNFQHWNGGCFLFNRESVEFLEFWHEATLSIFEDPAWKTRDQGTLIATVWKFGLQDQGTLPIEFNFLADYQNPNMEFDGTGGFSFVGKKKVYHPRLAHIYHHWGDTEWPVWQWVESLIPIETDPTP